CRFGDVLIARRPDAPDARGRSGAGAGGGGSALDGPGEIHQLDGETGRVLEDPGVPVELAEHDARATAVGDQLEAGPAGARGRVDGRAVDGDAVLGRLDDGVGLGVHR